MCSRGSVLLLVAIVPLLFACDSSGPPADGAPPDSGDLAKNASSLDLRAETHRETIRLGWEEVEGAVSFRVYRSDEAGFDTTGALYRKTTAAPVEDGSHEPGTSYHYRVAAVGAEGDIPAVSEEANGVSPPASVPRLEGHGAFYRSVLQWGTAEGAENGYHVYRSREAFSSAGAAQRLTDDPVEESEFTDSTALDGVRYTYRVAAVGPGGHEGALSPTARVTPSFEGDPLQGEELVRSVCADCHAAGDGWDLAAFGFPDTTIHRRGTDHVTDQEVQDIIRFIESKDTELRPGVDDDGEPDMPPLQPGGRVLESDRAFAMEVFGQDQWPEDLTDEELLSVDPRALPVPLEMPRWSVEHNDQDWLPEHRLPEHVRTDPDVQSNLSQYRRTQADEDLVRTVRAFDDALTEGERFPGEHGNTGRAAFVESFEMYRWLSTLIGTHHLRSGRTDLTNRVDGRPVEGRHFGMTNPWWRVGDIMRRFAAFRDDPPPEVHKIAARWFYLAWSMRQDVVGHEQKYMSGALSRGFGLKRVSAFSLAYGIVAGASNNHHLYTDLYALNKDTPKSWQGNLTIFLLEHLINRWTSGDTIENEDQRGHARHAVQTAIDRVLENNGQIPGSKRERIRDLQGELLAVLDDGAE